MIFVRWHRLNRGTNPPKKNMSTSYEVVKLSFVFQKGSLPETNSSHLKMVVSNAGISKLPGVNPPFSGALAVIFRECSPLKGSSTKMLFWKARSC